LDIVAQVELIGIKIFQIAGNLNLKMINRLLLEKKKALTCVNSVIKIDKNNNVKPIYLQIGNDLY
jgi:hypothetical protein